MEEGTEGVQTEGRIVKCGKQLVSYQKEVKLKSSGQKTNPHAAVIQYLHASTDCFTQLALKQQQGFKGLVHTNNKMTYFSLTSSGIEPYRQFRFYAPRV